jgi:hypothetical protein
MTGPAITTTPSSTPPTFSKTDYFVYTAAGHRDPLQTWSVATSKGTATVYIQGNVSGRGFPTITETHFAKKHLLSFAGGNAQGRGEDIIAKMQRIADKRARTGLTARYKKDPNLVEDATARAKWVNVGNKYAMKPTKKNTFIKVDAMTPSELKKLIAEALVTGPHDGKDAHADFPAAAVWYLEAGGVAVQLKASGLVTLGLGYEANAAGDSFVIKHLETDV